MDTISQEGFSKTKINKPAPRQTENLSEEEKEKRMKIFVKNNESDLKVKNVILNFNINITLGSLSHLTNMIELIVHTFPTN